MEVFYSSEITDGQLRLSEEESGHCIRVLRHRKGDEICVIDGRGTMFKCCIEEPSPKRVVARIVESFENWGAHPYELTMAVCPTKNSDRYEWFAEKACEMGVDEIVPIIGEHSERRIFKGNRVEKILVAAAKQSLKGAIPKLAQAVSVKDFIKSQRAEDLKLIAYCFEDEKQARRSIKDVLEESSPCSRIVVLIGPEGDFSADEAKVALENGFIPVHLGASRLRTETAAISAVAAVYFAYMGT